MNISKYEQRVLHALAQGGRILYERAPNGRVTELIESRNSSPYRISERGRRNVRAQLDNR